MSPAPSAPGPRRQKPPQVRSTKAVKNKCLDCWSRCYLAPSYQPTPDDKAYDDYKSSSSVHYSAQVRPLSSTRSSKVASWHSNMTLSNQIYAILSSFWLLLWFCLGSWRWSSWFAGSILQPRWADVDSVSEINQSCRRIESWFCEEGVSLHSLQMRPFLDLLWDHCSRSSCHTMLSLHAILLGTPFRLDRAT